MKYLVTVGTTSFDTLVKFLDNLELPKNISFIFQIANGTYEPKNYSFFRFKDDIWDVYPECFIITHCGAGTVYYLLEAQKKFIAVPNLERVDKHQLDLGNYIKEKEYALVASGFTELERFLKSSSIEKEKFQTYEKKCFFKGHEIRETLLRGLK